MARNYPHVQTFVDQMWPHAVRVGDQYGINPVTILTQAALETEWGKKVAGNNYFGVKSHGQPGGQTITTHEEINGQRVKVRDSFRKYDSMAESVEDYARFLRSNPRYQQALSSPDYRHQLSGIAAAGYATDSKYPQKVAGVANLVTRAAPPTPPAEIPNMVATALDVTPPRVPVPVTPTPDLQALRSQPNQRDVAFPQARPQTAMDVLRTAQMGTPDMGPINAIIARHQPQVDRAPITGRDLFRDSGIKDTINGTAAMQRPDLASALEQMLRPQQQRSAAEMASIYANGGPTRPQPAPRQAITGEDLIFGRGISDTTERTAAMQQGQGELASALERMLFGNQATARQTPTAAEVASLYAQGGPTRPMAQAPQRNATAAQVAAASHGNPFGAADGPRVSQRSQPVPRIAPGQSGFAAQDGAGPPRAQPTQRIAVGQGSFAAQEAAGRPTLPKIGPTGGPALNTAPIPAAQSIDMEVRRNPGQTVATIPTTQQSGVGQPPATKVVASVPVQTAPKTAQTVPAGLAKSSASRDSVAAKQAGVNTAANLAAAPKAGSQRSISDMAALYSLGGPTQPAPKMNAISAAPAWGAFAEAFPANNPPTLVADPAKPNPTGYKSGQVKTDNTRLAAGVYPQSTDFAVANAPPAMVTAAPNLRDIPVPRPRPTAVGTALSVTPPSVRPAMAYAPKVAPAVAPIPQRRNLFDMILPRSGPLASVLGVASAPQLRAQIDQQQIAAMAAAGNLNPESYRALSQGNTSYVMNGTVIPTVAMNGQVRNTYGDTGGSLVG